MKKFYKSKLVMLDYLKDERTNIQKYYFLFKLKFNQNIIYVEGELANSSAVLIDVVYLFCDIISAFIKST